MQIMLGSIYCTSIIYLEISNIIIKSRNLTDSNLTHFHQLDENQKRKKSRLNRGISVWGILDFQSCKKLPAYLRRILVA